MKQAGALIILFLLIFSCTTNKDKLTQEIMDVEEAFAQMVVEAGVPAAFLAFADTNAVLLRNNTLIEGKSAIRTYYQSSKVNWEQVSIIWEPEFIDVSESGDMAYTYGRYTFSMRDSSVNPVQEEGIFHTVWKRQADGRWKYVWD